MDILPLKASTAMKIVGVIEIIAAILMVVKPRYASMVVSLWLSGIVTNRLTYSGYYDVALRDFGLLIEALTLVLLAHVYDPPLHRTSGVQ